MMADDDEDDYLSDKFLVATSASSTTSNPTYAERRKQAQRLSQNQNERNRMKSRRQLEEESREEGLKKSLFERVKEEESTIGKESKAMSMMLKMGFKPGQSLGKIEEDTRSNKSPEPMESRKENLSVKENRPQHRVEPLPIDVWSGKKGVGLGKRALSPGSLESLAKAAKLSDETGRETFRDRTRQEYEEKRAEGRLLSATRTLITLDEKAGEPFNILSLNPHDVDGFPTELLEALSDDGLTNIPQGEGSENIRLVRQMRLDALEPLEDDFALLQKELPNNLAPADGSKQLSDEIVEQAKHYICLNAQGRLGRVLSYLRQKHMYCFWCGTQYSDRQDLADNCPGEEEEAHD